MTMATTCCTSCPVLLNELRENGYDIILVDFWDGVELMEINAAIVERVIRLCNENITGGNQPLVVAGASMGGQITRYALRNMELNDALILAPDCGFLWTRRMPGQTFLLHLQEAIDFNADMGAAGGCANHVNYYLQIATLPDNLLNYQT
jgi:pimeloyl-ACP methyl ester carboxylesterase